MITPADLLETLATSSSENAGSTTQTFNPFNGQPQDADHD